MNDRLEPLKASDMMEAMRLRERDLRARTLADYAVAAAMQALADEAPDDPSLKARDFAHRVAQLATALLISGIYIGDEEIRAIREERDHYKRMAEEYARAAPPRLVIDAITAVSPSSVISE